EDRDLRRRLSFPSSSSPSDARLASGSRTSASDRRLCSSTPSEDRDSRRRRRSLPSSSSPSSTRPPSKSRTSDPDRPPISSTVSEDRDARRRRRSFPSSSPSNPRTSDLARRPISSTPSTDPDPRDRLPSSSDTTASDPRKLKADERTSDIESSASCSPPPCARSARTSSLDALRTFDRDLRSDAGDGGAGSWVGRRVAEVGARGGREESGWGGGRGSRGWEGGWEGGAVCVGGCREEWGSVNVMTMDRQSPPHTQRAIPDAKLTSTAIAAATQRLDAGPGGVHAVVRGVRYVWVTVGRNREGKYRC
ncbi:hypothetical protein BDK51DRAFT_43581, partial [Blyttiomyces helicus]